MAAIPGLQNLPGLQMLSKALPTIPNELTRASLSYLDLRSLGRASAVNRTWRRLIGEDDTLWTEALERVSSLIKIPTGQTPKQYAAHIAQMVVLDSAEKLLEHVCNLAHKTPLGQKSKFVCEIPQYPNCRIESEFFHVWGMTTLAEARQMRPSRLEKYCLLEPLAAPAGHFPSGKIQQMTYITTENPREYSRFVTICGRLPEARNTRIDLKRDIHLVITLALNLRRIKDMRQPPRSRSWRNLTNIVGIGILLGCTFALIVRYMRV